MPVNERDEIKAKLAAQDERKNNQEDANFNRAKSTEDETNTEAPRAMHSGIARWIATEV